MWRTVQKEKKWSVEREKLGVTRKILFFKKKVVIINVYMQWAIVFKDNGACA